MANSSVIASDVWSYRGNRAVIIENELVKVTVLPDLGAKIYDLIYKPTGLNLLWHHPRIRPRQMPLGAPFDDVWCGGWDEIFPNDAPCSMEGQRYPDMGEAWSIPWDYTLDRSQEPSDVTLLTMTMTPITACELSRALTLHQREASLRLHYRIRNIGQDPVKFLWKIHPSFAVNETCSIEIPATTGIVDPRYRNLYAEASSTYGWPMAQSITGEPVNLSRVPPRTAHTCSLHYVTGLEDGLVTLKNPKENVDLKIRFSKQVLHTVWLFLAYGGYRSLYTAVIEPSTSYPYDLPQAILQGRYSLLEPGQELSCDLEVQLSEHSKGR